MKLREPRVLYKKIVREEESFDKWNLIDLRIGEVVDVKDHPNADRLYILTVNLGEERRTLVAGLKNYYRPEELRGKKIVIVANLEHANFRGVESQGMLLAGEDENTVAILTPFGDVAPGTRVQANGLYSDASEILKFKKFKKLKMEVINIDAQKLLGSSEYKVDFSIPKEWIGNQGVVFHDKKPLLLHAGSVLIGPEKRVKPGGKIR